MKRFAITLILQILTALSISSLAQDASQVEASTPTTTLQGRIMHNDTVPAAYATLYLPELGSGCVSDETGYYFLSDIPVGNVQAEYSSLGYATQKIRLEMPEANHPYAYDVRLEEQPVVLSEVYFTPNNEDPATYILRKVNEQAQTNRKALVGYKADINGTVKVRDLDFIPKLIPKSLMFMLRGALRLAGVNALFDYFFENSSADADYRYTQTHKNGKTTNNDVQVFNDQPQMSTKAKKGLNKVLYGNMFEELYGESCTWSYSYQKKNKGYWQLQGVIEEDGKLIDVLVHQMNTDSIPSFAKLYVVEEVWGIQRIEFQTTIYAYTKECRNIGNDIYLPISVVCKPIPFDMRQLWEDAKKRHDEGDDDDMDAKTYNRMEKLFNGSRDYKPYVVFPYTVKYSGISIK